MTATRQTVPLTRDLAGRLSAYLSANVVARVSGVLLRRTYKEGAEVKPGQLLFEIDPAFYRTVLNNNLAALAQDEATYTNAHVTAERDRKLLPVGSVSQQTVDDAEAAERSAAAKVQADQAAVEAARINLSYTRVSSPIGGIAGQQQVTQGALVGGATSDSGANGTLLTTVQQIDPLYVNFTLSAADLLTLRQARNVSLAKQDTTSVQVMLPDGSAYDRPGTLDFSDAAVNPSTGAVNLRALVANPAHQLLPGMYVSLRVTLGQVSGVFLIPQQALQRDTAGAYLLVVARDGKVLRKNVATGENNGNDWIISSGLEDGAQVIVSGLQGLREGTAVEPVRWQAPGATSAR
ncbi:MAG: efflux RND transporter periplasmic adaptor subunit [Sinobacteraceae bacterium]|nr:efflux RND transporter periplasmic adaptor subunit [Nevskiaceae bacterium]